MQARQCAANFDQRLAFTSYYTMVADIFATVFPTHERHLIYCVTMSNENTSIDP
jgi:hypothetical protein